MHRKPGLVGATMLHHSVMASIIADGYHVDWPAISIAAKMMGDRLFLITDAVTETTEGPYQHYLSGDRYEAANILSGSALTMIKSVRNVIRHCAVERTEAVRMASIYPAKAASLNAGTGRIRKGERAIFSLTTADLSELSMVY